MAISRVRVRINGAWTTLTKNQSGAWTGTVTAPSTTSYTQTNKYYPVTVEATNDAGTVVTVDNTDATFGASLRLVVKETLAPQITLSSPTTGAFVTSNKPTITFNIVDETSGSGVNLSSVTCKIDSTTYKNGTSGFTATAITNGYTITVVPTTALAEGSHTITLNGADNDGNSATAVTATIKVDTVPPSLTISAPANNLVTNNATCTVSGTTNDATSSPVTVTMTLNGSSVGTVSVGANGAFSKSVTLAEGSNTIVVTSTDSAGKTSSVTRTVKLDTSVPRLTSVLFTPNPANTDAPVTITIEVE